MLKYRFHTVVGRCFGRSSSAILRSDVTLAVISFSPLVGFFGFLACFLAGFLAGFFADFFAGFFFAFDLVAGFLAGCFFALVLVPVLRLVVLPRVA